MGNKPSRKTPLQPGETRRISVTIDAALDNVIMALQKTDMFFKCSDAEVIRYLTGQGTSSKPVQNALNGK